MLSVSRLLVKQESKGHLRWYDERRLTMVSPESLPANRAVFSASKGRVFLTVKATVKAHVDHSQIL